MAVVVIGDNKIGNRILKSNDHLYLEAEKS